MFFTIEDIKGACKKAIELMLCISGFQILRVLESSGAFCEKQAARLHY